MLAFRIAARGELLCSPTTTRMRIRTFERARRTDQERDKKRLVSARFAHPITHRLRNQAIALIDSRRQRVLEEIAILRQLLPVTERVCRSLNAATFAMSTSHIHPDS